MNVLLVGGGGREHALAWKLVQSAHLARLVAAPGNPGIARHAECVALSVDDHDGLVRLAEKERFDLVVVGPEVPLVAGLADRLGAAGMAVFGPRSRAAAIEGSKVFAKTLMARHSIPTARFEAFDDAARARRFARGLGAPLVVKTDGLAAGKGAIVCGTLTEAEDAIAACLERREFGEAGGTIVLEEFLVGDEVSFFALVNGRGATALAAAQDHKAVFDGDRGPNTGGMGAFSPVAIFDAAMQERVMATIVRPTIAALADEGAAYSGVLFVQLMLSRRCEGRGVQLPLRRSGVPGDSGGDGDRPVAAAGGGGRRRTASVDQTGASRRGLRDARVRRLSGKICDGRADHRNRGGGIDPGRRGVPRRHRAPRR